MNWNFIIKDIEQNNAYTCNILLNYMVLSYDEYMEIDCNEYQ